MPDTAVAEPQVEEQPAVVEPDAGARQEPEEPVPTAVEEPKAGESQDGKGDGTADPTAKFFEGMTPEEFDTWLRKAPPLNNPYILFNT